MFTFLNSVYLILTTGEIATGTIPVSNDFTRTLYMWNRFSCGFFHIFLETFAFVKVDGAYYY